MMLSLLKTIMTSRVFWTIGLVLVIMALAYLWLQDFKKDTINGIETDIRNAAEQIANERDAEILEFIEREFIEQRQAIEKLDQTRVEVIEVPRETIIERVIEAAPVEEREAEVGDLINDTLRALNEDHNAQGEPENE